MTSDPSYRHFISSRHVAIISLIILHLGDRVCIHLKLENINIIIFVPIKLLEKAYSMIETRGLKILLFFLNYYKICAAKINFQK